MVLSAPPVTDCWCGDLCFPNLLYGHVLLSILTGAREGGARAGSTCAQRRRGCSGGDACGGKEPLSGHQDAVGTSDAGEPGRSGRGRPAAYAYPRGAGQGSNERRNEGEGVP